MSALTESDEFEEWLDITLSKFPAPGPTISQRLVNVLLPVRDEAETREAA